MGYYMQGDYYLGDYYRGDPGLFGFLGKAARKIGGAALNLIPGPAGAAARSIAGRLGGRSQMPMPIPVTQAPMPVRRTPGARGVVQRLLPGGATGYEVTPAGIVRKKRRRMNVTNPKALRRAIRRQAGFVKLARRALKGTGYTITTRGSRRRPSVSVRESGPGSVTVR